MYFSLQTTDKKHLKFTTRTITSLSLMINQINQKILTLSYGVMEDLLKYLKDKVDAIFDLKEVIAWLDFYWSMASVANENGMTRPVFGEDIRLKDCANPILIHVAKKSRDATGAVANSVSMSLNSNLMLITGPNMSGKSAYVRQVALLQTMAQIGSFLPAQGTPHVRMMRRILTRIGADDDLVTNPSSYMKEVAQISYILSKLEPDTLVIIDEMGRGTSDEEGVSICVAVCEALLQSPGVFTLFATHFHDLVQLQNIYPFIMSFQMEYSIKRDPKTGADCIAFSHKLIERPLDDNRVKEISYGIELAKSIPGSEELVALATEKLSQVEIFQREIQVETSRLRQLLPLTQHLQNLSRMQTLPDINRVGEYLRELRRKIYDQ